MAYSAMLPRISMDTSFETFRQFTSPVAAEPLLEVLRSYGIPYHTVQLDQAGGEVNFSYNEAHRLLGVQIRRQDFERTRTVLVEHYQRLAETADPDHYLFSFSDEELMDVVVKPDEWSDFDHVLAQRILRERGRDVSPGVVNLLQRRRTAELEKPEEPQNTWIWAGYVFALLGGIIAMFIGWHLYSHRRTLSNGEQVHAFRAQDRVHGLRIFSLGIVCLLGWIALRVYQNQ
jgi:hypothetical protein